MEETASFITKTRSGKWKQTVDNFEVLASLHFIGINESIRTSMEIESSRDTNPDTQVHIKYQELSVVFFSQEPIPGSKLVPVKEPASLV